MGDKGGIAGGQNRRLDFVDLAVVLRVEYVVDGGQGDVLIATAVAGDEVPVEQLVVVGARNRRRSRGSRIEILMALSLSGRHEQAGWRTPGWRYARCR